MSKMNLFNSVKLNRPKRNVFDLTHDVKLSGRFGELIPTLCLECVPGDKFNIGCDSLLRFAPLVSPVMHRAHVTMHYFFVPNRIIWPGWEAWIMQKPGAPAFPYVGSSVATDAGDGKGRLMDYLGIVPDTDENKGVIIPSVTEDEQLNALPFAAYQKIYNEYYRDQNLVTAEADTCINGDNTSLAEELCKIRNRSYRHDYFTAALPFAQKGNPVEIPIGEFQDVPVKINDNAGSTITAAPSNIPVDGEEVTEPLIPEDTLYAETSLLNAEAASINDLRRAFRLQEWLERNARGGTRYIENILAHFGIKSSDKRLQRPEYITGTKSPVVISEIVNTTGEVEGLPQGNMAGHGMSVTTGKYGSYFCEEHGFIIGIMSIMPEPAYFQGVPKMFSKITDPFEYYWPSFAHIGEQEVKKKELMSYMANADANETFGYVPRYAEYKYMPSRVAGAFRTTLNFWHMARLLDPESVPALSQEFIECQQADVDRIFAVQDGTDPLWCHVLHKIKAIRPMPKFGNPSF